jgi:hypothetical protein
LKKIRFPIKRTTRGISHIVGLVSFEEDNDEKKTGFKDYGKKEVEVPRSIPPPIFLLMNFSKSRIADEVLPLPPIIKE